MSWPKRERVVWKSQRALLSAWWEKRHWPEAEGRCKGWGGDTALSFTGVRLWSHEYRGVRELARIVKAADGSEAVEVRWDDYTSLNLQRSFRQELLCPLCPWWRGSEGGVPESVVRVKVTAFGRVEDNVRWHNARVAEALGRWQRARSYKRWRMDQLERRVAERTAYEQVVGVERTPLEAMVRKAMVQARLTQ